MHPSIAQTSWLNWPQTRRLIEVFSANDQPLRFVGGAVRDGLLGLPVTDIDAATPASPQQVMGMLQESDIRVIPTGLSHGTVTAIIDGQSFEITTLRCDIKNFGRHAEVQFTDDWREDAKRRDFTINALYCDASGSITDFHSGLADLQSGHVRFIGNAAQRIEEDGLRILRFFRFSAFYGNGALDEDALAACKEKIEMLHALSGERIATEMFKLFQTEHLAEHIMALSQASALTALFGYLVDPTILKPWDRVKITADSEGKSWEAMTRILPLALLCRTHKGGAVAEFVIKRWRLSNADASLLNYLNKAEAIAADLPEPEQKKYIRALGAEKFIILILRSWVEILAQDASAHSQSLAGAYRSMINLAENWNAPHFPINGDHLKQHGLHSGKELGDWLKKLEQWWEAEHYQPSATQILNYFSQQR